MVLCPAEAFVSIVGRVRFLNEYYVVALLESKLEGGAVGSLAFVHVCLEYFQRNLWRCSFCAYLIYADVW
jgi:hypothetical protein